MSPPGTHFAAESTEAMQIKCLAQGHNIRMSGFEQSTSVTINRHSNHKTNMLLLLNAKLIVSPLLQSLTFPALKCSKYCNLFLQNKASDQQFIGQ